MGEEHEDSKFDDWLIKSMKCYRHLHMFDLQQPTRVIEWIDNDGVLVAGCDPNCRNEVLELSTPAKLMRDDTKQSSGLTKDRDFRMKCGGFTETPVHCLKYLRGALPRRIVTGSPACPNLDLWQLGTQSSDVIKKLGTINGQESGSVTNSGVNTIAIRPDCNGQVTFGSSLSDIQVVDVETGKVIATGFGKSDDKVEVDFAERNILVICNVTSGLMNIHDIRTASSLPAECDSSINQSQAGLHSHTPDCTNQDAVPRGDNAKWTFDIGSTSISAGEDFTVEESDCTQVTTVRFSSNGEILTNDIRKLSDPLHCVQLAEVKSGFAKGDSPSLTVKCCPTERHLVSLSGLNGCVDIFDTTKWQTNYSASPPIVKPIFSHDGHVIEASANEKTDIFNHTWHRTKPRLLLSSGTDGSLHAWQWTL